MTPSSRVAVVTDSTSDIPPDVASERGVTVVPLAVQVGDRTYRDGDLTQEEFFALMASSPKLPTTSQPSVGEMVEAYGSALEAADEVVALHISSKLSGTFSVAETAAREFGGRVHVFDSLNLSWGLAFQVLEAAAAAAAGASVDRVLAAAASARDRVGLIVGLDSLDNLAKGGRIGAVGKFLGSLLDLKVVFTVVDGAFKPLKRVRGGAAALDATLAWVAEQMGDRRDAAFAVLHAMSEPRARDLAAKLGDAYRASELFVLPVGSVISTHTGTGWGIALLPAE
ncbi:MAG: DegV family protein [Actinobacteria bacterium]|nr:MAG: DegV family protein [Actinomycetota bacterium]